MLELSFIANNKDKILEGLKVRKFNNLEVVDAIIALDEKRKHTQTQLDSVRSQSNKASKEIGVLFREGKSEKAEILKQNIAHLKGQSKDLSDNLIQIEHNLRDLLYTVPNIPHPSVPTGNSDADNEIFKECTKEFPNLPSNAKCHWDLIKEYNIIDLEVGVKITGAGFPVYKGQGARLQRALINFFLDEATEAGYQEIIPPHLVNEVTATGTGQLPDKEGQMYHVQTDDLYLIPTAEVPITNIYRDMIVEERDLPIKLTGYTPCFRREVGSYGKDVRGLNRVHQFDKVEIVQIQHPKNSYNTLQEMLGHVSSLLDKLELPYRILRLCGGDLGFTSALTFDFEVYSAAQEKWLEVSSVSNFETFQSNRMKLRFRNEQNKAVLAHTLNGSALALARIVAALLENNQTPEGIKIPKVLRNYTRFDKITK